MKYKENGLFEIKPFESISDKELKFVFDDIKKTIGEHNLKGSPNHPMSRFVAKHFPKIWFE